MNPIYLLWVRNSFDPWETEVYSYGPGEESHAAGVVAGRGLFLT